jgi:hypothetical protein
MAKCIVIAVVAVLAGCAAATAPVHGVQHAEPGTWNVDVHVKLNLLKTDGSSEPYYEETRSFIFTEGKLGAICFGDGRAFTCAGVLYWDVKDGDKVTTEPFTEVSVSMSAEEAVVRESKGVREPLELKTRRTYFTPVCLVLKTKAPGGLLSNPVLYGGVIMHFSRRK